MSIPNVKPAQPTPEWHKNEIHDKLHELCVALADAMKDGLQPEFNIECDMASMTAAIRRFELWERRKV